MAGFMGGVGFTMIAFHVNHKNILNENLCFRSVVFLGCLVFVCWISSRMRCESIPWVIDVGAG